MVAHGLWEPTIARLPFTSATIYLVIGLALGPLLLNLFSFDPPREAPVLEVAAEIAVLISLFSAGIKMPVPFSWPRWLPAIRLAWLAMTLSVVLIAGFAVLVLDLPPRRGHPAGRHPGTHRSGPGNRRPGTSRRR